MPQKVQTKLENTDDREMVQGILAREELVLARFDRKYRLRFSVRSYVQDGAQAVYRPRDPQATDLFALVEDNFDELERVWDERYEKQHGFWRPIIRHVVQQYMDCGDLRCGFARIWCPKCRIDLLLPYSCRRKRALLFAEHVDQEVLGEVPIRQYVVTIPKMLRLYFKYDRKLLGELSRCLYESIKEIFLAADPSGERRPSDSRALPGMVSSVQTYGEDPSRFHPHVHVWLPMGCCCPTAALFPFPGPIRSRSCSCSGTSC
jgi:hypothetical protein